MTNPPLQKLIRSISWAGGFCFALLICGVSPAQEEIRSNVTDGIKLDYLQISAPVYPGAARERGWEGTVILKALVEKDGTCSRVAVEKSSGYRILDDAAMKAVNQWKFSPAQAGGAPYAVLTRVPIRFVLTDEKQKTPRSTGLH